jgi:hypothetical protein
MDTTVTIGATRQLLKDQQWRREHPSPVKILRGDDGTVQTTISPQDEARVAARKLIRYLGGSLACIAIVCVALALWASPMFWLGAVLFSWVCIAQVVMALVDYHRGARSVVIRVGRDTVSIDSTGPFGRRHWEARRDDVRDIRLLGPDNRLDRKLGIAATFRPMWLVFDVKKHDHHYLRLMLLPDDFIRLADALRDGCGLPRRSWE